MKNTDDIINKISTQLPNNKKVIKEVVYKTFSELRERMSNEDKIMLRGFFKLVPASNKKSKVYTTKDYQQLKTKDK